MIFGEIKRAAAIGVPLALMAFAAFADGPPTNTVTLAWNASPDESVIGFRLYQGVASNTYTNFVEISTSLTNILYDPISVTNTVSGLVAGTRYFFAVTAYDFIGLESLFSNEISYDVPTPPPSVRLTSPADGATFSTADSIPLGANASEFGGSIASVSFYANTSLLGTVTNLPYTTTVPGLAAGAYVLTAAATDAAGLSVTSAPVTIIVVPVLPPPQLAVNPASLSFGLLTIGQTATQNFQVVNAGGLTLTGTILTLAPFKIAGGSPFSLPTGQTGLVSVSFSPSDAGVFTNVVVFTSNAGNSTNVVTGSAVTPAQLAVWPASMDFGTVAVGATRQRTFTITNLGGAAMTNGTASVSSGPFTIVSGSFFTLPGFGSSNVMVQFAPGSAGSFSNAVLFTSDGGKSTNALTGAAAVIPLADFTANPTSGAWPLTVSFTDNSSGTITNRSWDFGDNTTTNTMATSLTHTYAGPGTNTVSLTVSALVGTNTLVRANFIIVTNLEPVTLTIQFLGNQVQLTWPAGTLQSASQVNGPYTDLPNATSPYLLNPFANVQFFRIRVR